MIARDGTLVDGLSEICLGVLNMADALPGLTLVEQVVGGAVVAADQSGPQVWGSTNSSSRAR